MNQHGERLLSRPKGGREASPIFISAAGVLYSPAQELEVMAATLQAAVGQAAPCLRAWLISEPLVVQASSELVLSSLGPGTACVLLSHAVPEECGAAMVSLSWVPLPVLATFCTTVRLLL